MDIRLHFSESENQFFVLSNLSEWHFSCRAKYNHLWRAILGDELEKVVALEKIKEILKREGFLFQREYLETEELERKDFFQKKLSSEEAQTMEDGISFIKAKWYLLWNEEKSKSWKVALENEIKKPRIDKLISDLAYFYGGISLDVLDVHIFLAPTEEGSGGGANIGDKSITLEIPKEINQSNIDTVLGTLLHELSHILLRTNENIMSILKTKNKSFTDGKDKIMERSPQSFLNEGVIYITTPLGYPCNNAFKDTRSITNFLLHGVTKNKISQDMTFYNFMRHIVWGMYPTTGAYFEEKKVIDELFIDELLDCLDFYIKKIK